MNNEKKLYDLAQLLMENGGPIPMSKSGLYLAAKHKTIPTVRVGRRIFVPSWFVESILNDPNKK